MKLAPVSAMLLVATLSAAEASAQSASSSLAPSAVGASAEVHAALVVIVADEPGDAASSRLDRDLRSLGFAVMLLAATPENSSDDAAMERTAQGLGAVAAVRLLAAARGSKLWVSEPATQRSVTRSLAQPAATSADPNELALGTLELLRASVMELHPRPLRPALAKPPQPVSPRAPVEKTTDPTFSLSGALAADLGLRSIGPSISLLWAAWLRVGGCLGVRGFAALPLFAERRDLPEGQVEVEPMLLGLGLSCTFARGEARLWPRASLGVAGAHVVTRGTAVDALRNGSAAAWLGGGYGMLGLGLKLARDLRLTVDATGVLLPTPAVIVADRREVGTWGAPAGIISLGVEVLTAL